MIALNLQRVKALFNRDFHTNFKPGLAVFAIVIVSIFTINTISSVFNDSNDPKQVIITFGLVLLIGGFINASLAFRDFHKVYNRAQYLSLPGSSLEKVLVKWFYSNPLFIAVTSLIFYIVAQVFMRIQGTWTGNTYVNEIFVSDLYWRLVGVYFIIHSVFFLGSIVFNRGAIFKTLVVLLLIAMVIILINAVWFRILFAEYFDSFWSMTPRDGNINFGNKYQQFDDIPQIKFFVFAFKFILAPVLWVASIFKLSEKEV